MSPILYDGSTFSAPNKENEKLSYTIPTFWPRQTTRSSTECSSGFQTTSILEDQQIDVGLNIITSSNLIIKAKAIFTTFLSMKKPTFIEHLPFSIFYFFNLKGTADEASLPTQHYLELQRDRSRANNLLPSLVLRSVRACFFRSNSIQCRAWTSAAVWSAVRPLTFISFTSGTTPTSPLSRAAAHSTESNMQQNCRRFNTVFRSDEELPHCVFNRRSSRCLMNCILSSAMIELSMLSSWPQDEIVSSCSPDEIWWDSGSELRRSERWSLCFSCQ